MFFFPREVKGNYLLSLARIYLFGSTQMGNFASLLIRDTDMLNLRPAVIDIEGLRNKNCSMIFKELPLYDPSLLDTKLFRPPFNAILNAEKNESACFLCHKTKI